MKIFNITRKTTLAEKVEVAASPWQKTKGLMFRGSLKESEGLLMDFEGEKKPGIWMPLMQFPLDLVFISADKKVVDVRENVRPISFDFRTWRIYVPKEKCRWVLEINAGDARKAGTKTGDILSF